MKRRWCLLWVWMAVGFLLLFPHRRVSVQHPPQSAGDRSSLGPSEFMCTWCRTLLPVSSTLSQSRASPLEMFTVYSEFLITDNVGLSWLDHRGPPGARACGQPRVRCKAASQTGSVSSRQSTSPSQKFPTPCRKNQTGGFSTAFS